MDMSGGYRAAVTAAPPKAKIVFDRFHVMKLFNDRLSELRRSLHREATDVRQEEVLKGTRRRLLKAAEDLDEVKDERKRLEEALALNKSLATAYTDSGKFLLAADAGFSGGGPPVWEFSFRDPY